MSTNQQHKVSNMIQIRLVSVKDLFDEPNFKRLSEEYTAESLIEGFQRPDPDLNVYEKLESLSMLDVIAAYDGDLLVGFISLLTSAPPHYKRPITNTESFFVTMPYRKAGVGLRLLKAAEEYVKMIESPCLTVCAPVGGQLDKVMSRVGYRHTTNVYMRMFDE